MVRGERETRERGETRKKDCYLRPLAINCFLDSCGQREKFKGERENTKPFPLYPAPFPDLCKKSLVYLVPLICLIP